MAASRCRKARSSSRPRSLLSGPGGTAQCTVGGVTREVQLDFVPEVEVGEYVIVHVGFALSRLDAEEAARTLELLKQLGEVEEEVTSDE